MRISDSIVEKLLERNHLVGPEQLESLKQDAADSSRPLDEVTLAKTSLSEADLVKAYAEYIHVPFIELDPKSIDPNVLQRIPERIANQYKAILFKVDEDGVSHLALEDPDDVQAVTFLQKEIGQNLRTYIATHETIMACLDLYHSDMNEELKEVIKIQPTDNTENPTLSEQDVAEDSPIAQTVNLLLEYAIRSGASDIHIEPREDFVQVRYRIDGVLKEVNRLPVSVMNALVSRIKILSNLKIDEHRIPQDGRFKITVGGKQYALRVSTLPIADGEKIVMRILDESTRTVTLEQLGYWGHSLKVINEAMAEPDGMILVTGPTGSGKSTSLFAVLSMLNTPEVNISTIEDPVEYKIKGVNQTQTNSKAGMTFASGLRALLRQDPNIIMVGEIRDGETADLGIQAALTGHLVFSTLHTNNAATALPRLLDMNIEPFLIASTVKAIIGQRLVRKLCPVCREQYQPTEDDLDKLRRMFGIDDEKMGHIHALEAEAAKADLGGDVPILTNDHGIEKLWRASTTGCDECNHTGYKGRMGIYEVLGMTSKIEKLITAGATSDDIQSEAIVEGMVTMQTDGLIKALRGITTTDEVLRVTRE